VAPIDPRIDELYRLPPDEFVPARTALAKTLTGADAKAVKGLVKPTVVPWTVNQVYWHARDVYSRMLKAGEKLRDAQLNALKGRAADVRGATTAHRQTVSDAVKAASRFASEAGLKPDAEQLARMLEAVSLQQSPPEPHGRFTKPIQPQGFEALAGVAIKPGPHAPHPPTNRKDKDEPATRSKPSAAEAREERRRQQDAAEAARRHQAAIKTAETELDQAKAAEDKARKDWERARHAATEAEQALADLRKR
jgi:hypothetical protein